MKAAISQGHTAHAVCGMLNSVRGVHALHPCHGAHPHHHRARMLVPSGPATVLIHCDDSGLIEAFAGLSVPHKAPVARRTVCLCANGTGPSKTIMSEQGHESRNLLALHIGLEPSAVVLRCVEKTVSDMKRQATRLSQRSDLVRGVDNEQEHCMTPDKLSRQMRKARRRSSGSPMIESVTMTPLRTPHSGVKSFSSTLRRLGEEAITPLPPATSDLIEKIEMTPALKSDVETLGTTAAC